MGLKGAGAVVIWHDIEASAVADYYAWHGTEHLPERLSIPGFLRGRRYGPIEADLDFFTLYETEAPETTSSPAYMARLDNPSAWSQSVMPHFRGMTRSICQVERTVGVVEGGLIATWRYDVGDAAAHRAAMGAQLEEIAKQPGVCGAHLLSADMDASGLATAEQKVRGTANITPPWTLLVEGSSEAAALKAVRASLLSDAALRATGVEGEIDYGLYQLQASLDALTR